MTEWANWSGRLRATPNQLHHARSEADVAAVIAAAAADSHRVRVAGAGHSHAPLVPTDDVIIDLSGLCGIVGSDGLRATVRAGTPIFALGAALHARGLALANQGDIDRQSIGGATATGTHGSGLELGNLSSSVVGARVVLASGEAVEVNDTTNADLLPFFQLHLGAGGVVTELDLSLRSPYVLDENGWVTTYEDFRDDVGALVAENRHFEFFWYPHKDRVVAKTMNISDEAPQYPVAAEGRRRAWSFEVLANHRPVRHTEMEFSVPLEVGRDCFEAIRDLLRQRFASVAWPVEYRTIAGDDLWLSTAGGGPVVTISVHQGLAPAGATADHVEDTILFQACEEVFRHFGGRPHWGKVHFFDGSDMAAAYPDWEQWWAVRERLDPGRVFLNEHLEALAP